MIFLFFFKRKNHAGEIICSAQNAIGQTSKQFTLIVLDYQTTTAATTTIPFENIASKSISILKKKHQMSI